MEKQKSELVVVMKAKDLCRYVMTVTQKTPKQYRFTFTSRMQNLCLDIIEDIYLANETFVAGSEMRARQQQRLSYQHRALTKVKLLAYFAQLGLEQKAILPKQYEQIAKQSAECQFLLGGWIKSDRARFRQE
ncbi:MAG: four helix bundle protein [Oscillospiraceae bacterium]|nr:four helix bundle protein [Oscillospiraceae bacterium]